MGIFSFGKSKEQRHRVDVGEQLGVVYGGDLKFGRRFSKGSALSISAVFACVEMISNALAMMPIAVKSSTTKGKLEQLQLNRVFKHNKVTKYTLVKQMVSDMLLYGNGYAYIERSTDGIVVGLTYLPGDQVTIYHNEMTNELYYMYKGKKILPKDIVHIYKNSYDGYCGVSMVKFAHRSIDLANAAEDSALDYYGSGMNINGIIHAKTAMTQHQADQAVKSMQGSLESIGAGKLKFLPFDLALETLSQNADDAALVETRTFNVADIARYFNIPVSMLTENNQNAEAINLQFLTQTLTPYITLFEDELNRKLLTSDDLYFDFDDTILLRTDAKSTAEYYGALVEKGIMTRAEVRDALGLPVIDDGLVDKLTVSYSDIEQNTLADNE